MVSSQKQTPQRASGDQAAVGRLFLLDLSDNRVVSLNPDGSDRKVIVTECRYPDGIAVDVAAGHIYWTNMGVPKAERRLHRASRPRRAESQDDRSPGRHVHAQAAPARKEERKAVLVRPRGHARDARQPRRLEHRDPRGHEPGRPATGAGCHEVVRGRGRRCRWRQGLLDAKRSRQRRQGPHLPRRHRNSHRTDGVQSSRYRSAL